MSAGQNSFCPKSSDQPARLEVCRPRSRQSLLSFERPPVIGRFFSGRTCGPRAPLKLHSDTQRFLFDQENKSTRWMPWRQEPMKDVGGCDKRGGGADQPLIPRSPNGKTYAW